eukprot:TRINITY_DN15479_c0_g1_i3.p1 TRINITY_DN15479_c0_g1~~TRINITY_DN15479_c0_g1_i3.p1  ORF type:complete len:309 (-),score=39.36 TRINITY_DN15479_c0_g1_i3:99-1025(-)
MHKPLGPERHRLLPQSLAPQGRLRHDHRHPHLFPDLRGGVHRERGRDRPLARVHCGGGSAQIGVHHGDASRRLEPLARNDLRPWSRPQERAVSAPPTFAVHLIPGHRPLPSHAQALQATNRSMRKCHVTGTFKPMRAHFDREIQRCVVKMDHHCPWVNNCVGIGNQKLFILFVGYVALGSGYALMLVLGRYFMCVGKPEAQAAFCSGAKASDRVLIILLCVESVLFGLFTTCMACEQITSVMYNQTYIDRLQARRGDTVKSTNHGILGNLREVFGDTDLSLIHISEPTRLLSISYAVFCLKKKKKIKK